MPHLRSSLFGEGALWSQTPEIDAATATLAKIILHNKIINDSHHHVPVDTRMRYQQLVYGFS
jgi:hypothetical protein